MSEGGGLFAGLGRFRHPRLVVLVVAGTLVGLVGTLLALLGPASGFASFGPRLAILGAIVLLFGASGMLAFAVFERGFD